ncbi:hypothetical protein GDO81_003799 [Engystomops pustulosus]|uniref:Uncharacterized protein n=1 Tax=Engystomops pustulosus TaxID=76066 RepID=A0AAV6ZZC1_ENGPU|nr:hypothetical protein GDO81_003799 [Engystomops pustulosus]
MRGVTLELTVYEDERVTQELTVYEDERVTLEITVYEDEGGHKSLQSMRMTHERRILSPETDSGFLGSESGRSLPIHKQRDQLSLTREHPQDEPDSNSNTPIKSERRSSKSGDPLSRTRKTLWDKRKPRDRWAGLSEASSPSPGPKSLTDSDSREHTDESGSGREAYNNGSAEASPGDSQLLLPMEGLPQPHEEDILQSRAARDQAIHSLQKEVSHLRKHLESSLQHSPVRGKSGQSAANRRAPPGKQTKEEHFPGSFAPRDHDPCASAAHGGRTVQGAYTGTQYHLSRTPPHPRTERFSDPPCQRCQENERKNSDSMKAPKKEKNPPMVSADCPLCLGNNDSGEAPRDGIYIGEYSRRPRRRPHCKHWIINHTPPVSYVPSPVVHYSPPIIYGTPTTYYTAAAYNAPQPRRPRSVTPPPSSHFLELEDITWPLNRALEAAKELKSTSRRMCRSLTVDLSVQRNFRGSCLF